MKCSFNKCIKERKRQIMDVWDPGDKSTVFCEIKKRVEALFLKKKRMTRVIVWPILIVFYFFIFFLLLSGCAYFQKDKIDDDEIIITDLPPLEMSQDKKIACIKLEPECDD